MSYTQAAIARRERRIRERVLCLAILGLGVGSILLSAALIYRLNEIDTMHRAAKPAASWALPDRSKGQWV